MDFNKSHIIVNNTWQPLLILSDDKPIKDFPNNVVVEENEYFTTNYYTNGVYKSFQKDGKFINWYLINSKETKEKQTQRIDKLESQNAILDDIVISLFEENEEMKQSQSEQDDSIITLYETIGGTN